MKWDICSNLHAMSDMSFASPGTPTGPSGVYTRAHTYGAECYAKKCRRRGKCLVAKTDDGKPMNSRAPIRSF